MLLKFFSGLPQRTTPKATAAGGGGVGEVVEGAVTAMEEEYDSDGAPEELTFEQDSKQDEEIREVRKENKMRVSREKKERRRLWAQRKTQKPTKTLDVQEDDDAEDNTNEQMTKISGMLPINVIHFLASREKRVFSSDSEKEETVEDESAMKKRKQKNSRGNTVLLKDLPPPPCAEASLDFLKKRKLQVPRSRAVLTNADQALRLLSSRGGL